MPQKNLRKKATTLMPESLVRILITVILVVAVIALVKKGGEAAGLWGKSQTAESAELLVAQLNSVEFKPGESRQQLLRIDDGTAVIGFSKNSDYECYGCGSDPKGKLSAKLKRPDSSECKDSACICVCYSGLPKILGNQNVVDISCGKLACKKLNIDIITPLELGELIKKRYGSGLFTGSSQTSSWKGGFMYIRNAGEVDAKMSGLPKEKLEWPLTVIIEKKIINGNSFIGVCPERPCIP